MNQERIITTLSNLVKQILGSYQRKLDTTGINELATRIAHETWSKLIVELRRALSANQPAKLTGLGLFERTSAGINFIPEADLLEAASLSLEASQGQKWLADRAAFYLEQGNNLLQAIPKDLELEISVTALEGTLQKIGSKRRTYKIPTGRRLTGASLAEFANMQARDIWKRAEILSPKISEEHRGAQEKEIWNLVKGLDRAQHKKILEKLKKIETLG